MGQLRELMCVHLLSTFHQWNCWTE